MSIDVSFDEKSHIVATKGLQIKFPWTILSSTKYYGRYYFLNTKTNETFWSLPTNKCSLINQNGIEVQDILIQEGIINQMSCHHQSGSSDHLNNSKDSLASSSSFSSHYLKSNKTTPILLNKTSFEVSAAASTKPNTKKHNTFSNWDSCLINRGIVVGGDFDTTTISLPSSIAVTPSSSTATTPTATTPTSGGGSGGGGDMLLQDDLLKNMTQTPSPKTLLQPLPKLPCFNVVGGLGIGGFACVLKVINIHHHPGGLITSGNIPKSSNHQDHQVEEKVDQKYYAMKLINKNNSKNKLMHIKHQKRIKCEIKCLTMIKSSNFIQKCHLIFEDKKSIYFILDYYSGGDLYYHLLQRSQQNSQNGRGENNGGFTEKEAKIILSELFLAIEHIHSYKIIHRDIKIENIMLDGNGHVKLIDFGLCREIEYEIQSLNTTGSLIYMAPELLLYKTGGRHTDWWAYGVLAHELFTGTTPWATLTNTKLIKKEICKNKDKSLSPLLSYQSKKFIKSLLQYKVEERLGTISSNDVKNCSFFKNNDWNKILNLKSEPAFNPYHHHQNATGGIKMNILSPSSFFMKSPLKSHSGSNSSKSSNNNSKGSGGSSVWSLSPKNQSQIMESKMSLSPKNVIEREEVHNNNNESYMSSFPTTTPLPPVIMNVTQDDQNLALESYYDRVYNQDDDDGVDDSTTWSMGLNDAALYLKY